MSAWVPSPVRAFQRLSIRAGLLFGFGLILTLWVLCGFYSVARVAESERRLNELNASYTRNEELLLTLRYNVPMAAVFLRDNLLDFSDDASRYYNEHLNQSRKEIEAALAAYVPMVDSAAQRESLENLQVELKAYWATISPAMTWDTDQKQFLSRRFLQRNVIRKRNLILRISERIQTLNRAGFEQRQHDLSRIHQALKRRIWWTIGVSALLGLAIAFAAIWHAGSLEGHILRQHSQEQKIKNDLRRLSTQLVQIQEQERRNIARELHDEVGQALTALKMELALTERELGWRDRARLPLKEARSIADRTLQVVRDLSRLLHPAMLDDLGLPDTIRWNLAMFSKRTGIESDLVLKDMDTRLAPETELTAYRFIQEALSNVARHSGAKRVWLSLERLPFALRVCIEDDGQGFDFKQHNAHGRAGGLGLIGMQERISAQGGDFRVETAPGRGTRLSAELPALTAMASVARDSAAVPGPALPEIRNGPEATNVLPQTAGATGSHHA